MSRKSTIFISFILVIFSSFSLFSDIDISISPSPIIAGEPAYLTIRSSKGIAEIIDIPDVEGIRWLNKTRTSSNITVINGQRFDVVQYGFIVDKAGKFSLPSFTIKCNNEKIETQSRDFVAHSGALSDIDKLVCLEPKFNTKGKVYVGQSVQLDIYLLSAMDLSAKPTSYPQLFMDNNVLFDNFSSKNNDSDRFAPYPYYPPEKAEQNGTFYVKTCFMTSFRPMAPGKIKGHVSLPVDILVPNTSSSPRRTMFDSRLFNSSIFDDPFFSRDKRVSRIISANLPEIEILNLPRQPENTNFLGLFGIWNFSFSATPDKLAEGETLTIKVEISGYGSLETLRVPELTIPGFISYKPEIHKNQAIDLSGSKSKAEITYLLIPRTVGEKNLSLSFATFNTNLDKYDIYTFNKTLDILKNENIQAKVVDSSIPNRSGTLSQSSKNKETDSILHIKKNISANIKIPLWRNYIAYYIILILLGPIIWGIVEAFRKKKSSTTESWIRKQKALKKKSKIIREMKAKRENDFINYVDSDVVPFINDVSAFPPGTTSYEFVNKLDDKTLKECFEQINNSRYTGITADSEKELKNKISKYLKRLSIFIFTFFAFTIFAQGSAIDDFSDEYNKGNFQKAKKICFENINNDSPSPGWIYNLANTYVQEGNLAEALVYYQRALLLNPRDQDTLQNLNYVRRLLFLPELYQTKTPLELLIYLRDILRPDEWLLSACALLFSFFILITVRRKLSSYAFLSTFIVLLALIIISIGIFFNQKNSIYSSGNAIITVRNPVVHSLPRKDSPEVKISLGIGDNVKIQDRMDEWTLISSEVNKTIGWVKSDVFSQIWPY